MPAKKRTVKFKFACHRLEIITDEIYETVFTIMIEI